MFRSIYHAAFYLAYLILVLLALDYFLFVRPYQSLLRERGKPKVDEIAAQGPIDADTMRLVGARWPRAEPRSIFLHYTPEKKAGGLRICAFGDSFVFGTDLPAGFDYPSLLQERLSKLAPVEVLNFGKGWLGFHQTMILWKKFARAYNCDITLFGPGTFFPQRDTSFNHTTVQKLSEPYYIHARYVMRNDRLELIRPSGATHTERFDNYYSMFPSFDYVRYDTTAPAMIAAPLFFSLPGERYSILFIIALTTGWMKRWKLTESCSRKSNKPAFPLWFSWGKRLQPTNVHMEESSNLKFLKVDLPRSFPYRTFGNHYSAVTNELLAEILSAYLLGKDSVALPLMKSTSTSGALNLAGKIGSACERAIVELSGNLVGALFDRNQSARSRPDTSLCGQKNRALSLAGLKGTDESLLDATYVGTDAMPGRLSIQTFRGAERLEERPLAAPTSYSKDFPLHVFEVSGMRSDNRAGNTVSIRLPAGNLNLRRAEADLAKLVLDGAVIFAGPIVDGEIILAPLGAHVGRFKSSAPIRSKDFPESFCFDLKIVARSAEKASVPFGCYKTETQSIELPSSGWPSILDSNAWHAKLGR